MEEDCVNKYRQNMRDGRIISHIYPIHETGKYSFK